MRTVSRRPEDRLLLETCRARSIELLRRNLSPGGILAATPGKRADLRGYTAIFGRDAAVCALGMAVSGDELLEREAATGLHTLAEHQAPNGQIPKFVDLQRSEADFWYLGCIDSTLWWLIALAFLDARAGSDSLRRRYRKRVELAVQWLLAQEHQRFFLLQQNEASDWADIMPRSGFVLYTNALWYLVKRLYRLERRDATLQNFTGLFHPFSAGIAEYRRARLLNDYVLRNARDRDLYLSFVNFSFCGEEGDVFGNVLAVLLGLADGRASRRTLDALTRAHASDPYPVRAVTRPIKRASVLWRPYMARHRQNLVWQYHNGGIWPMVGGFWVTALVANGRKKQAKEELVKLARACAVKNWAFTEWLHGRTLAPRGMPGQSWNAAAYLMAERAVAEGVDPFWVNTRSDP
ncbi:MAG TPA: glycoside hydrolase 100 family protein [Steroidobacteraceae bacterium]